MERGKPIQGRAGYRRFEARRTRRRWGDGLNLAHWTREGFAFWIPARRKG
jgi:hypothetical protein